MRRISVPSSTIAGSPRRRIELLLAIVSALLLVLAAGPQPPRASAAGPNQYSSPDWLPLRAPARVTCALSNCSGPYHGYWAVDLVDPEQRSGDPIFAAGAGRATIVGRSSTGACGGSGTPANVVRVDHGSNVSTYYYHLAGFTIADGQWVDQNTQIGTMGTTGYTDPCPTVHLHFEKRVGGTRVDPGSLKACHGGTLVRYGNWNGATQTVRSDGTGCEAPVVTSNVAGRIDTASGAAGGFIQLTGWLFDPDAPTASLGVHVYIDGPAGQGTPATFVGDVRRDDIAAAYPGKGPAHGFAHAIGGIQPGRHTVYVYGIDAAGGQGNPLLGQATVDVSGLPAGAPEGNFETATGRVGGRVDAVGWTLDPDDRSSPTDVHFYLDGPPGTGRFVGSTRADASRPDVADARPGAGPAHGFSPRLNDVTPGRHVLWAYAINRGAGDHNTLLRAIPVDVPGPRPIGSVDVLAAHPRGNVVLNGWTLDPDAPDRPNRLHVYVDGGPGSGVTPHVVEADLPRPDVADAFPGAGAAHGFAASIPGLSPGRHRVMVYAIDVAGEGDNPLMADAQIDVGDGAAGSPFGSLDEVLPRDDGTVAVRGWSVDPDVLGSPTRIHVYADGPAGSGTFVHEGTANSSRPDVAAAIAGAGPDHGYELRVPGLAPGPHQLFVYAINAGGGGDNPLLGSARAVVSVAASRGPGTPGGPGGAPSGTPAAGGAGPATGAVPPTKRVGALGTLRSATVRFTTKKKRGVRRRYAVVRAAVRGTSAASRLQFSTNRKRILSKTAVRSSVSVRTTSSRIYVRLWAADGRRGPWVKATKAKARTTRRG